jgi:hypothetical protein
MRPARQRPAEQQELFTPKFLLGCSSPSIPKIDKQISISSSLRPLTAKIAGTFITATFTPGPSPSELAILGDANMNNGDSSWRQL